MRDLRRGRGQRLLVSQALVDGNLLIGTDAQRLVQFAAHLQDVGDLTLGDRRRARVPQAFEHRQLFFGTDAQCLAQVAAHLQDIGDLTLGDRRQAHVPQAFEHRQLFFGADAQRLVQFAARLQEVGYPPPSGGSTPTVVHACQRRQGTRVGALRILRLADGSLQVTELKQQVDVHWP